MKTQFLRLVSFDAASKILKDNWQGEVRATEKIPLMNALGRVLVHDMVAPEDLPGFARSTMDGYAVRARDTFGASESLPGFFKVVGEVHMGADSSDVSGGIGACEAIKIATGGMLPAGADAVVMCEYVDLIDGETITVLRPVAPGENVVGRNEDMKAGDVVLHRGHRLRPQDIGALAGLGIGEVDVAAQPEVALISTGDEVVDIGTRPGPGKVRDINSYSLHAMVLEAGGEPLLMGIVPDDPGILKEKLEEALRISDMVVISGGSSIGARDYTVDVINSLGRPGVLVHGVALKPGKPTILAVVDGKPVFGLPGHPVSAMNVFGFFIRPAIEQCLGLGSSGRSWRTGRVRARMAANVASVPGREDRVTVRLVEKDGECWAEPVFGKSAVVSVLVRADGIVKIPLDKGGLSLGEEVEVFLF